MKLYNIPVTLIAVAALFALLAGCAGGPSNSEPVVPVGGEFVIDAKGIPPGEARFFHYDTDGKRVVFMVARTDDGEIKTAFDACVTCYPYKKGYVCERGGVVCVQCGTYFGLDELGVGKGNCIPIKINHAIKGDNVVIELSEVRSGTGWF